MTGIRPFFTYYGGKWRAAPHYPAPRYDTIVEPFAGAAGYALRYPERRVILIEKNPKMAAVWRYLLRVSPSEVRRLPLLAPGQTVNDLSVCEEARYLIGLNLAGGAAAPLLSPTQWMHRLPDCSSFWVEAKRERIAQQVERIRHWWVIEGDYSEAFDIEATWFIDPPYTNGGHCYPTKFAEFEALGSWCKRRQGQVIVCESEGANWLPFRTFRTINTNPSRRGKRVSHEVIWTNDEGSSR